MVAVVYMDRAALVRNVQAGRELAPCINVRQGETMGAVSSQGKASSVNILDAEGNVAAVVRGVWSAAERPGILNRTPVSVFVEAPHGVELVEGATVG